MVRATPSSRRSHVGVAYRDPGVIGGACRGSFTRPGLNASFYATEFASGKPPTGNIPRHDVRGGVGRRIGLRMHQIGAVRAHQYGILRWYIADAEGLRGIDRTSMPVGGHSNTARRRRTPPRPGLTRTVFHHPSSDVQSHVAPLRRRKGYRLVCRAQQQVAVGTGASRIGAVLWELAPGRRPNWRRLKSLAQGMPVVSYFGVSRRRCGYAVLRDRLRDPSERSPESGGGRCTRRPRDPLAAVAVFALALSQSGRPMTPGSGSRPMARMVSSSRTSSSEAPPQTVPIRLAPPR